MSLTGNISRKQYLEGEGFPRGNDGISPTVEVSEDENGHRVEITDVYGTKSFVVKNGDNGDPGEDYVLTEADKKEIAEIAAEMVDVPGGGGNVDLTGYATEQFVRDGFQPKGNYLTSYTETDPTVPAWAKAESKPSYTASEVGLGNVDNVKQYSTSNPPPYPVTSVNGKTGAVTLDASAVDARPSTWVPSASEVGALPASTTIPTKVSQLANDKGYLTQHQDISGKLDASALPTAINTALAQAKASGEFDGKDGKNGKDGQDGYTPIKGVDYFDGDPGEPGKSGVYILSSGESIENAPADADVVIDPNGEVDIPTGGGGGATDPVEAWKDLASATIAKADAVKGTFVDTGLTFGDLKQYKEIIFRIGTPNSGPDLLSMRVLIKTNQAVDWYSYPCLFVVVASVKSANIAKISFANSQKDIWSCVIGVGSSYDAFQNDLGANNPFLTGNAATPYELYGMQTYHKKSSAMSDSDHIQFYFNAAAPADIRYKITGVFQ